MWAALDKISEQVSKYGTIWSKVYYILVFIFRLIVVAGIGIPVYGDEQSAFKCSEKVLCQNLCYDQFAKLSHMRFWSFQMLAIIAPTIIFHCYATRVSGQIEKLKEKESQLESDPENDQQEVRRVCKRKRALGDVKVKMVYTGDKLEEVPTTKKVHVAYYCTNIIKMAVEIAFMYLAFQQYYVEDPQCGEGGITCGLKNYFVGFMWMSVNAVHHCQGEALLSCSAHLHGKGYIPCFVSRPTEKTFLFRYMNIMSAACLLICGIELVAMTVGAMQSKPQRRSTHRLNVFDKVTLDPQSLTTAQGPLGYPSTSLCVPIKISDGRRFNDEEMQSDISANNKRSP